MVKKRGGKWKWVIIAFVVICVLGAVGGSNDKPKEASNTNSTSNTQLSQETKESDVNSSESKQEEVQEEAKDKYHVGDTWENKYVLVSFDECGEYSSDNQFIQPADGNKYVYATFTFENVGKSDTTVAYWDFDCYADGYACDGTYGADDAGFSQTLSSGRKISGSVYFEVPEDSTDIEFEFSPSFWSSEKVIFVYE